MAKKQDGFTLEGLQNIKQGQTMPLMQDMRDWLINEHNFRESGDNLLPPIGYQIRPIYLNESFGTIDYKTLNHIIHALEAIEAQQSQAQQSQSELPEVVKKELEKYPAFDAKMEANTLVVSSREYPEFNFQLTNDNQQGLITSLRSYLETYSNPEDTPSLPAYISKIKEAENIGLRRTKLDDGHIVYSLIDGSQSAPLSPPPAKLIETINEAIDKNNGLILEQMEFVEGLIKQGFSKAEYDQKNQQLIIEHPVHKGETKAFATHGTENYLTQTDWEALQTYVEETIRLSKGMDSIKELKQAAEYKQLSVSAPDPTQTLLSFDAGAMLDLAKPIKRSDPDNTWIKLLKMTQELPSIGRVIIPDYIADVELRNQAYVYDKKGQPTAVDISAQQQPPEKLKSLLRKAIRRHINDDGEVVFLAPPGVKDDGKNIIIWETRKGRKKAEEIAKNNGIFEREKGFGASQINEMLSELDWPNPVNVIANNLKFMHKKRPAQSTLSDKPVTYDSFLGYLEAELAARGREIQDSLGLEHADAKQHYKQHYNESQSAALFNEENIAGHYEAESIRILIQRAVGEKKRNVALQSIAKPIIVDQMRSTGAAPTPPVFSKVTQTTLGSVLSGVFKDPKDLVKQAKAIATTEHTRIRKDTVMNYLDRSDVLYAMLDALDKLALENGKNPPSNTILSSEDMEADLKMALKYLVPKKPDQDEFLKSLAKKINDSRDEVLFFGEKTAGRLLSDEFLPEVRLASVIRDVLKARKPDMLSEYDTQYFTKRVLDSKSERAGGVTGP